MPFKSYTERKNGKRMATRNVKIHIPLSATKLVMEKKGCSQREAEQEIMLAMFCSAVSCSGLVVSHDGHLYDGDDAQELMEEHEYIPLETVVVRV